MATIDFDMALEEYNLPEVCHCLFFPRREYVEDREHPKAKNYFIKATDDISIGCRFYPAHNEGPNILYFHGNGEVAADYDYIAPLYQKRGLNLFVADYRGYGASEGKPTCLGMIKDAHPTFHGWKEILYTEGYRGKLYVMGRSLGSAPAIEIAYHYQNNIVGLIIESGFASSYNQIRRLGVAHLFRNRENLVGFGNDLKIKEIHIPTLIIHGEWDEIIPVTEGRTLYELSGAVKKTPLFVNGAGHNDLLLVAPIVYMNAIERFIISTSSSSPLKTELR
ncbi:MAG: alpha/beta hydrolase [Syntrophorhabdaceae bacterium]|nr:alpha/beta hydrolase [Syntrophorhabdales bacterium]MBP9560935.1 alpha/beta hydrolase [Syntrophorhabdaceae bacterium]